MLLINFYLVIAWVFGSVSGPCPEGADWKISPFSIGALKQLKQNLFNYFEQLHFIFFPCCFFCDENVLDLPNRPAFSCCFFRNIVCTGISGNAQGAGYHAYPIRKATGSYGML